MPTNVSLHCRMTRMIETSRNPSKVESMSQQQCPGGVVRSVGLQRRQTFNRRWYLAAAISSS